MSGTEPDAPAVPPVLLPGAAMDAFIGSIAQLALPARHPRRPGGVVDRYPAVGPRRRPRAAPPTDPRHRLGVQQRDRHADGHGPRRPRDGHGRRRHPAGRSGIDDALVDVIDTFPIEPDDLPDDPKERLFVCAHRYAYETATPVDFVGDTNRVTVQVATVEGLIAMKSHALRFGRPDRRRLKRSSDLYDVVRLTTASTADLLVGSPWDLRNQVLAALAADLADLPCRFIRCAPGGVRRVRRSTRTSHRTSWSAGHRVAFSPGSPTATVAQRNENGPWPRCLRWSGTGTSGWRAWRGLEPPTF